MIKSGDIVFEISGDFAMFATPQSKCNCECISYPYPTYSAVCGMLRQIYNMPWLIWVPDAVRVMNKINYVRVTKSTPSYRFIQMSNRQNFIYSYLEDVRYQIKAHYVMNYAYQAERALRFNHDEAINNIISNGCNNVISLGKRECVGITLPCVWGEDKSYYDESGCDRPVRMFHSFEYTRPRNGEIKYAAFTIQQMVNGIIDFNSDMPIVKQRWKK